MREVDPGAIQKELDAIWESLETTNTTRACLFNLIFYTKKNARTGYIQRLAQAVIEKFPSRVMLITLDDDLPTDALTTRVSILTSSKGEYDVACDLIQIDAAHGACARIPFILLPHILPDLPIYLLIAEDPVCDDPLSLALEKGANRIIFDSESTQDLSHFALSAQKLYSDLHADIADLNWARIESWREMIASTLGSNRPETVQVKYNAHKSTYFCHTHIQAVYLQAWLAAQLDWTFESQTGSLDSTLQLHYTTNGHPVNVSLIAQSNPELPPGLILETALTTADGTHFAFSRDVNAIHQITLYLSTPTQCLLPSRYIFPKAEVGHSLIKEICHRGTSLHFLKTLALVQLLGKLP